MLRNWHVYIAYHFTRLITNSYSSAVFCIMAIIGFIAQVIGLGCLHWSATVVVLGVSLVMTATRAWVRRALAKNPLCIPIPTNVELPWIALRIFRNDWEDLPTSGYLENLGALDCQWGIVTGIIQPQHIDGTFYRSPTLIDTDSSISREINTAATEHMRKLDTLIGQEVALGFCDWSNGGHQSSEAQLVMDLLSDNVNISQGDFADTAGNLATAMCKIMEILKGEPGIEWKGSTLPWRCGPWQIDLQSSFGTLTCWTIHTHMTKDSIFPGLLAGLSLWVYSMICANNSLRNLYELSRRDSAWPKDWAPKKRYTYTRIIGNTEYTNKRHLKKWLPDERIYHASSKEGEEKGIATGITPQEGQSWVLFGLYFSTSMMSAHSFA